MAGIFTRKALADVLNGESTPEEAAQALVEYINKALNQ